MCFQTIVRKYFSLLEEILIKKTKKSNDLQKRNNDLMLESFTTL